MTLTGGWNNNHEYQDRAKDNAMANELYVFRVNCGHIVWRILLLVRLSKHAGCSATYIYISGIWDIIRVDGDGVMNRYPRGWEPPDLTANAPLWLCVFGVVLAIFVVVI